MKQLRPALLLASTRVTDGFAEPGASAPDGRVLIALTHDEGRSYDDVASVLGTTPEAVRDAARALGDELVGDGAALPPRDARHRIVDYALGQQPASDRARTRALLEASKLARNWSEALTGALPAAAEAGRPGALELLEAAGSSPLARGTEPATPGETAEPSEPATSGEPAEPELADETEPPAADEREGQPVCRPGRRRAAAKAGALVAATGAVAVALVLGSGSSSGPKSATTTSQSGKRTSKPAGRTLKRLVLQSTGRDPKAAGAGAVVEQGNSTLLLLEARGLAPNRHNSYAVWLYNTPVDSRLLGFVSPAVSSAGTFSSGTPLPDDAVRFGQVLITLETLPRPTRPGPTVLHSRLTLG